MRDPYESLAQAIILQAVKDYRRMRAKHKRHPKNKEAELADQPHKVAGMLLYARTDEEIYPEKEYRMSGNQIVVRTLNLDGDFDMIKNQLNEIAEKFFGKAA